MKKGRKKYTNEEKLTILKEAGTKGVNLTLEKYGIYPATYYSWKKILRHAISLAFYIYRKFNHIKFLKNQKEKVNYFDS